MVTTLSYPRWLAYGVGHVLNDLCSSVWFSYTLLFFACVLRMKSYLAGTAVLIGQVADGLATPLIGILLDNSSDFRPCKYGRRKFWHLLGSTCVACSFPFIFSPCYGLVDTATPVLKLTYYSVFIIVFQFGWACTQVSHLSLVPELSTDQHERNSLLTLRYFFTVLSNIFVYVVFFIVLHVNKGASGDLLGPGDENKFQLLARIIVILGFISTVVFHIVVVETDSSSLSSAVSVAASSSPPTSSTVRGYPTQLFRNTSFYAVAGVYVASRLFVNLSQTYMPYYVHTYLKLLSTNLALIPLTMFVGSFCTSLLVQRLNVQFGSQITYVIGALIGLLACLWIRVGDAADPYFKIYEIYAIALALGCASAIVSVTSLAVTTDLIGHDTNIAASVYGFLSFGDKISNGLVVFLIESTKSLNCESYYRDVLSAGCSVALLLALLAILALVSPSNLLNRVEDDVNTIASSMDLERESIDDDDQSVKQYINVIPVSFNHPSGLATDAMY